MARNSEPDSLDSDPIPDAFQNQVWRILFGVVGTSRGSTVTVATDGSTVLRHDVWKSLYETVAQEAGIKPFPPRSRVDYESVMQDVLIRPAFTTKQFLGHLDLILHALEELRPVLESYDYNRNTRRLIDFDEAKTELNHRLKQNQLPYEIDAESWLLFRVDSELLTAEAVMPALRLLRQEKFRGAESEFLSALDHHRHGRDGEAVTAANAALESVLKQVCEDRKIKQSGSETGGRLLKKLIDADVIVKELGGAPDAIDRMYGSTLGSLRDQKSSAHGSGADPREVEEYVAAFAIHSAASFILLVVQAHLAKAGDNA